jgi:glutamate dehydrogenase
VFNPTMKANGWESPHTVLQIVNDDMPFLVDTVTMSLAEQGVGVHVLGHPVLRFTRDKAGKLVKVGEGDAESVMLLEIDRQPAEAMAAIEQAINKALDEVRAIVRDWQPMKDKALALADDLGKRQLPVDVPRARKHRNSCAGPPTTASPSSATANTASRSRARKVLAPLNDTGLGLMRGKDKSAARRVKTLAAQGLNATSGLKDALILTKTNARSRVPRRLHGLHRRAGIRRQGQDHRRAALPRPVHLQRLQPSPVGNPAGAPAPRARDEAVGPGPGQPQWQGPAPHPETLPREELFQSSARTNCSAPRWACWACRSACAAACSCAATSTAAFHLRAGLPAARALPTPTCACASKRC